MMARVPQRKKVPGSVPGQVDYSPNNIHTLSNREQFLGRLQEHLVAEGTLTTPQAQSLVGDIRKAFATPGIKGRAMGVPMPKERLAPSERIGQQRALFKAAGSYVAQSTTKNEGRGVTQALKRFDQLATQKQQKKPRTGGGGRELA